MRAHDQVVFTHDLDFGALLAATHAPGPGVIQVRAQDVLPQHLERVVVAALQRYEAILEQGALIIVDERTSRARICCWLGHDAALLRARSCENRRCRAHVQAAALKEFCCLVSNRIT